MMCHYPERGSASVWPCRGVQPVKGTTQIWVATRHQYGISPLVSQMSFRGVGKPEMVSEMSAVFHMLLKWVPKTCCGGQSRDRLTSHPGGELQFPNTPLAHISCYKFSFRLVLMSLYPNPDNCLLELHVA